MTVIIHEDNDTPGRKHSELVARNLNGIADSIKIVSYTELKEKQDVTDYLEAGNTKESLQNKIQNTQQWVANEEITLDAQEEEEIEAERSEVEVAKYEDFRNLFVRFMKNPNVDIFSQRLMTKDNYGTWQHSKNMLGRLRSEAMRIQQNGGLKFPRPLFDDHLETFEAELEPKLLLEIPKWDGVDRIAIFANYIELEEGDVTNEHFYFFLKDWLCKAYRKVFDPYVQNRICLLYTSPSPRD